MAPAAGGLSSSPIRWRIQTRGLTGASLENDRNPREDRRLATALWLQKAERAVELTSAVDERARLLTGLGFGPLDALHLAFAEHAQARWFVTTDDRLLRKALEHHGQMQVEVVRPDQLPADAEEDRK